MKKKVVRLTEEDLVRIVKRVVSEQNSTNIGTVGPRERVKLGLKTTTNNKELNVLYKELKDFMFKGKKLRFLYKNVYIQDDKKIVIINMEKSDLSKGSTRYKVSEVTKDNGEWWVTLGNEKMSLSEFETVQF